MFISECLVTAALNGSEKKNRNTGLQQFSLHSSQTCHFGGDKFQTDSCFSLLFSMFPV